LLDKKEGEEDLVLKEKIYVIIAKKAGIGQMNVLKAQEEEIMVGEDTEGGEEDMAIGEEDLQVTQDPVEAIATIEIREDIEVVVGV
jgi:hypothetical protein